MHVSLLCLNYMFTLKPISNVSNFRCVESNANEFEQRILFIYIRFDR